MNSQSNAEWVMLIGFKEKLLSFSYQNIGSDKKDWLYGIINCL